MTEIDTTALPELVSRYLERSQGTDPGTAISLFAESATVTDSGARYSGRHEVLDFLQRATTEFEYTSTLIGAESDARSVTAINRLEGNFPGGVVELHYRFILNHGETAIEELVIS